MSQAVLVAVGAVSDRNVGPTTAGTVRSRGTVQFSYDGCEVTVDDEVVRVRSFRENRVTDD